MAHIRHGLVLLLRVQFEREGRSPHLPRVVQLDIPTAHRLIHTRQHLEIGRAEQVQDHGGDASVQVDVRDLRGEAESLNLGGDCGPTQTFFVVVAAPDYVIIGSLDGTKRVDRGTNQKLPELEANTGHELLDADPVGKVAVVQEEWSGLGPIEGRLDVGSFVAGLPAEGQGREGDGGGRLGAVDDPRADLVVQEFCDAPDCVEEGKGGASGAEA